VHVTTLCIFYNHHDHLLPLVTVCGANNTASACCLTAVRELNLGLPPLRRQASAYI
jgi:hypothetical protein